MLLANSSIRAFQLPGFQTFREVLIEKHQTEEYGEKDKPTEPNMRLVL